MDEREAHASRLVADYAAALGIAPPDVRFVQTSPGPCYEALFNRIEIDSRTLGLPEPALRLVLAHEVAHATQRAALLADFLWIVLRVTVMFSVPCILFAALPDRELWRVSIPGACFALIWVASWWAWRIRASKRAVTLELDADAKATQLCGSQATLSALEVMLMRGYIDADRFHAMQDRLPPSSP
ncbi:conserved hypothetical protein [Burkholderia sp. 8Y]|uniref:M48 family metalloprotease n=1 Tax=Burkholderia sp. 8Y TaxID=2653133 RepID=UPI0012F0FF97|nr:M48 family metalloprotease [Burkholderia sp. 8Y]VXB06116.1 conserved hypothetical protein [Burkholderia sp. 8Y]